MMVRRRILLTIPTLLGVSILVFAFLHLIPGDPVEAMLGESAAAADVAALRRALGLDRPVLEQLARFLLRTARGDLGESIAYHAPVRELLRARWPATIELAIAAFTVASVVAVPLGLLAALRPGSWLDRLVRVGSLVGVALPTFWIGPLAILVFSLHLGWLPPSGRGGLAHVVLPAVTLGAGLSGILLRLVRTTVLATLREDFVRTARAKGAPTGRLLAQHALRPALGPVLTVAGLQVGALLAGAVVTETIFAWPGIGRLLVQAIAARDYPLVQGCVLVIGATYVLVNLVVDLLQARIDPRVRDD